MKKLLFVALFMCCQTLSESQRAAEEIIAQHLAAKGGSSAWDSVKTAKMDIQVIYTAVAGMESKMTQTIVNLKAHRMDIVGPFKAESTIAFNGNKGWSIGKSMGQTARSTIDSAEVQELKYQTDLAGPLHHYQEKGYKVTYLGKDTVQNAEAHKIKIELNAATTYYSSIDIKTHLEVKRVIVTPIRGKPATISLYYSDHKTVGNVVFPHRVEMHNSKGVMVFVYHKIELNLPVDPKVFEMPGQ